jgi:hypothetical protein
MLPSVIIEAPSMFQARMTAVVRRLAPGVPFGEGPTLSAGRHAKTVEAVRSSQEMMPSPAAHFLLTFGDARRPPVGAVAGPPVEVERWRR